MAVLLTNSNEGITPSGTTVTIGNSGGASGNAWDATSIGVGATDASDSAHAAHGALSNQLATAGTAGTSYNKWTTSAGSITQHWFRLHLYFTANPAASHRVYSCFQTATLCAAIRLGTSGTIALLDSAGTAINTTTNSIPLNQWFRIEGFVIGSATVGQIELKLFTGANDVTPLETLTTTAAQNTTGAPNDYRFGMGSSLANVGPFWMDDVGMSDTGYVGPIVSAAPVQPFIPAFGFTSPQQLAQKVARVWGAAAADVAFTGVTAALVIAAPAGSVSVGLPGVTAGLVLAAPVGSVSVDIRGSTATVVLAAPAGAVSVGLPGATGTIVFLAPAGSVSTGADFSANGVTATVVLAARTGSVSVGLPGTTATVVFAAPAGRVSVGLPGVTATVVFAAPAGKVSVGLPGATATVVFGAPAGGFAVPFQALGVTALLVFAAPAGSVQAGSLVTLTATPRILIVVVETRRLTVQPALRVDIIPARTGPAVEATGSRILVVPVENRTDKPLIG